MYELLLLICLFVKDFRIVVLRIQLGIDLNYDLFYPKLFEINFFHECQ